MDLSDILTEEIERDVKEAAEISMGTEINTNDEKYIQNLATQIVELGFFLNQRNIEKVYPNILKIE